MTLLLVLASLFARVDIATKALYRQLKRLPDTRRAGLSWLDAWRVAGMHPIAGGSLTETAHPAGFVIRELDESDGGYGRESITVLSGQNLGAGRVIGRVTLGIGRASVPSVSGTGNGTISGVTVGEDVEVGSYVIKCTAAATDAGTFSVTSPSGLVLPSATVAVAYTSTHLNFTLNDGGTDFAVNDTFTVVVGTTAPVVVGTGNGTIGTLALKRYAIPGNYQFVCIVAATNAATFELFDPKGRSLGIQALSGSGATATFTTPQISAVITDGSTDFAVGDLFNVAVYNQLSGGKVVAWDPTTFDGRHVVAGVLWGAVDASSADTAGVILARGAVVAASALGWGSLGTGYQSVGKKQLLALGIVAR